MHLYILGEKVVVTHTNDVDKLDFIGKTVTIDGYGELCGEYISEGILFRDYEISKVPIQEKGIMEKLKKVLRKIKEVSVKVHDWYFNLSKKAQLVIMLLVTFSIGVLVGVCL